jgi:sugar O-acyltransferase (sialic acid O-acetyltransferase NeuD family)
MLPKKYKLVIYGTGKLAEYAFFVFTHDSDYEVVGFCVEKNFISPDKPYLFNLPICSLEEVDSLYPAESYKAFVAVGNNSVRDRIYNYLQQKDYSFANYISSKCELWSDCKIGTNVFIGEGCVIQPFSSIGNNCLLFVVTVGHHSTVGDHVTLSVCTLGGNVTVLNNTFIGLNASVNHNITIGKNNIIGAGCTIIKNTKDNEVYSAEKPRLRLFPSSKILSNFLK